jgi:hypothetical protein
MQSLEEFSWMCDRAKEGRVDRIIDSNSPWCNCVGCCCARRLDGDRTVHEYRCLSVAEKFIYNRCHGSDWESIRTDAKAMITIYAALLEKETQPLC